VKVGNFIGDWIKGNDYKNYPADIQKGILMHRSIDSFTDNHPIARLSKNRLNDDYHKYSGIIIDIFYDHFLACNWKKYSDIELVDFTKELNNCLMANMNFLPKELHDFIPSFMRRRWLESYATLKGIEKVLQGMSRHTSLPDKTTNAIDILKTHYESLKEEFFMYFPQLVAHVEASFGVRVKA
jgi:acyl carrier protein phosphodiesterase